MSTQREEIAMQTPTRTVVFAALATALFAAPAPALAGPPWISIELPADPYDPATRGAFLVVRAFHCATPANQRVTGTAEGIVNGERRTLALELSETGREGVYALKRTWPAKGTWTLVLQAHQGPTHAATAILELGPDGAVTSIRVPTMDEHGFRVPAPVASSEIEEGLRARAAALVGRS
jgi:hypothetical protein